MSWLTGWSYRKSHTINPATGAGANYQVRIRALYKNYLADVTALISQTQVWTGSETWTSEQQQIATDVIEGFGRVPWQRHTGNPVINYDDNQGESVILDGSTYKMFYGDPTGIIMLATSPDGKTWTRYNNGAAVLSSGSPGAWDDEGVTPGGLIKDGSTLKMWYHGFDGTTFRIGLATSTDGGYNWTKDGANPVLSPSSSGWDGMWVACCRVIKEGSGYKMWYVGYPSGGYPQIGYATSPDGTNWTKYGSNPVIPLGGSGAWDEFAAELLHVFKIANKYVCFYEGAHDYGDPMGVQFKIGVAYSTDGIAWTKHPDNPVFSWGESGQWDDFHVLHPSVVWNPSEKKFYLYYSGTDGTTWATIAKIGLAIETESGEDVILGNCRTDFGDVRFTDDDGETLLPYWIEEEVDSDYAVFWVKVTDSLESAAQTIYIYYGKSDATSISHIDNTSVFGDEFTGANGDPWEARWTTVNHGTLKTGSLSDIQSNQGRIYQASSINTEWSGLEKQNQVNRTLNLAIRVKITVQADEFPIHGFGFYKSINDLWDGPCVYIETGNIGRIMLADQTNVLAYVETSGTHIYELQVKQWQAKILEDGVSIIDWTTFSDLVTTSVRVAAMAWSNSDVLADRRFDDLFVRKFVDPEPTHGEWGSEEQQTANKDFADVGGGIDLWLELGASLYDWGSGSELPQIAVAVTVADSGLGTEVVQQGGEVGELITIVASIPRTDVGAGVEVIGAGVVGFYSDTGHGEDVVTPMNAINIVDAGAGVEVWSSPTLSQNIDITDAGVGVDLVPNLDRIFAELGLGVEVFSGTSALPTISDTGVGVDSASAITETFIYQYEITINSTIAGTLVSVVEELNGDSMAVITLPNSADNRALVATDKDCTIKWKKSGADIMNLFYGILAAPSYTEGLITCTVYDKVYEKMRRKLFTGTYDMIPANIIFADICAAAGITAGVCPTTPVTVRFDNAICLNAVTFLAVAVNKDSWSSLGTTFNIGDKGITW